MQTNEVKKEKLGIKDFVLMGIFGAIMFVLAMVLMTVTGAVPAVYLFYPAVFGFFCAPLYMLLAAKIQKFGAFLIPSMIIGILLGLMGAQTVLITVCIGGVISELIAYSGKYKDTKRIIIAYVVLMVSFYAGDIAPIYVFTEWYINMATGGVSGGVDMTYINSLIDAAKSWLGYASIIACIITSLLGAFLGKKILKKHFEKAGLI